LSPDGRGIGSTSTATCAHSAHRVSGSCSITVTRRSFPHRRKPKPLSPAGTPQVDQGRSMHGVCNAEARNGRRGCHVRSSCLATPAELVVESVQPRHPGAWLVTFNPGATVWPAVTLVGLQIEPDDRIIRAAVAWPDLIDRHLILCGGSHDVAVLVGPPCDIGAAGDGSTTTGTA